MKEQVRPVGPPPGVRDDLADQARWVRRLALAVVNDEADAADLVQETLVTALRQERRPGAGPAFRPWLRAIFNNVLRSQRRTWARRTRRERDAFRPAQPDDPEALLDRVQLQRAVARSLAALPPPLRQVLELRYAKGLSAAAIAEHLGLPPSTVRSRIALGLRRIRAELSDAEAGRSRLSALCFGLWRAGWRPWALLAAAVFVPALVTSFGPAVAQDADSSQLGPATRAPPLALRSARVGAPTVQPLRSPGCEAADMRPRLLLDGVRLCELRARVEQPGTVAHEIYEQLRARVDRNQPALFGTYRLNYARGSLAQAAAFLYLLSGERRYALQAFENVAAIYQDPGEEPTPDAGYPLARALTGAALAFVYDWAQAGLGEDERRRLERWLDEAVGAWPAAADRRVAAGAHSYWLPSVRSAEVLQILALDGDHRERLAWLERVLVTHVDAAYGPLGLSQEGQHYTSLSGTLLVPAALALEERGRPELAAAIRRKSFWKGVMFQTASGPDGVSWTLPNGAGLPKVIDEGWMSLLFAVTPPDAQPAYRHFYDRQSGRLSPRPPQTRFEARGTGQVWALMFYPERLSAQDPSTLVGYSVADETRGLYLFRSGWRGGEEVLASLAGDFSAAPVGFGTWETAEAFQLGVLAHGTRFFTGRDGDQQRPLSTLLVDGRGAVARADRGARGRHEPSARGGYVVVDGGEKYRRLGLTAARRHLLVDFAGAAVLSTVDELRAPSPHLYTWQAALGAEVTASSLEEGGRPCFLLRGRNDAYLKGWVMSPGASVRTGELLQISARGGDVDLWVVMITGTGTPPAAEVQGEALEASLTVGQTVVRWDRARGRPIAERAGE